MSPSPFAAAIAQAKEAEAQAAEQKRQRDAEQAEAQKRAAAVQAKERQEQALVRFGERFLEAVVKKVLKPEWKAAYIEMIEAYALGMLAQQDDPELPRIDRRHAERIQNTFAYGLELAFEHGTEIPEGHFYGQRLLATLEEED